LKKWGVGKTPKKENRVQGDVTWSRKKSARRHQKRILNWETEKKKRHERKNRIDPDLREGQKKTDGEGNNIKARDFEKKKTKGTEELYLVGPITVKEGRLGGGG